MTAWPDLFELQRSVKLYTMSNVTETTFSIDSLTTAGCDLGSDTKGKAQMEQPFTTSRNVSAWTTGRISCARWRHVRRSKACRVLYWHGVIFNQLGHRGHGVESDGEFWVLFAVNSWFTISFFTQLQRLQLSLKNFHERNHHATGNCSGCLLPALICRNKILMSSAMFFVLFLFFDVVKNVISSTEPEKYEPPSWSVS